MLVTVVDDHRFRAMGTECHVLVVDGGPALCDLAERLVRDAERRWSRFLPDSELSRANDRAGSATTVSSDTVVLASQAIELSRSTEGWFDPLVGLAVHAAGYDRSFELVDGARPPRGVAIPPAGELHVSSDSIRVPAGSLLDLGGIAKGHTADRVLDALFEAGAAGACVNLGGDLRCGGESPDDGGWWIGLDHVPGTTVGLTDGAVATSTTTRRRWTSVDGSEAHHLIDPRLGRPCRGAVRSATVVAGTGTVAEALTKVAMLAPAADAQRILAAHDAVGLTTDAAGRHRPIGDVDRLIHRGAPA